MKRFGVVTLMIVMALLMISCGLKSDAGKSLDVTGGSPLVLSPAALPNGTVQAPYSALFSASGGTQPYVWSIVSGALPAGISLFATTGVLAGTPSQSGGFSFTGQVRDSSPSPQTALNTFTITVAAAPPAILAISTSSLPQGTAGQSYAASLQASGGTPGYTWGVTFGSLPAGLSLASSDVISGTPLSAGSSTFTVQVVDSSVPPASASQSLTLNVNPASQTDMYGGFTSLPSPNGGTGFFRLEKFANRWMFVTPAGNAFWMRSIFAGNAATNIDSAVYQSKYNSDGGTYYALRNQRYVSWGFNTIGEYSGSAGWPVGIYGAQDGDSTKLPFNIYIDANFQVLRNPGSVGLPEQVKSIIDGVPISTYNSWRAPLVDFYDPKFAAAVANVVGYWDNVVTGGFADKPWVLCVTTEDADDMWGFKSRGDAPVVNYPHPAFLIATAKFLYTSTESWTGANWIDAKLYSKYAWIDWLKVKYSNNIANLNAAWNTGSFYTSFDDAGGYGVGTGVIDEDGRHTAWMGSDPFMLSNTSAGVKADVDGFLYEFAKKFATVEVAGIRATDPNHVICGPVSLNNYGAKARDNILKGMADGGIQVFWFNYDPNYGPMAGSMVDDNLSYDLTGKPAVIWYSVTAQADSEMSASLTIWGQPDFPTQAQRGTQFQNVDLPNFLNAQGANGDHYVVGYGWWQLVDNGSEGVNWGLITFKDNPYDGTADKVNGEAADYGDALSSIKSGNLNILQNLLKQLRP